MYFVKKDNEFSQKMFRVTFSLFQSRSCQNAMRNYTARRKHRLTKFQVAPITLFLISTTKKVALRDYNVQKGLGRTSFDYIPESNGLIIPANEYYEKPNGMSLRPEGVNMWDILSRFNNRAEIQIIPKNALIPPELVLCLEHGDHYSLQTSEPVNPKELNARLNAFLADKERISKEEYFKRYSVVGSIED